MENYNYNTIMYKNHPVKIIHRYPNEYDYYFNCKHCGTRYAVNEHYVKIKQIASEFVYIHNCPKCNYLNNGSIRMPGVDLGGGYNNDW